MLHASHLTPHARLTPPPSLWNSTLLVITYDEHGGFFDHVPPPHDGVPSPDDLASPDVRPLLLASHIAACVTHVCLRDTLLLA